MAGIATAAMIPTIETTIINSIRVKPFIYYSYGLSSKGETIIRGSTYNGAA